MLAKFTQIKHGNNTNITQSPGTYILIYDIPARDSKPKSKYTNENKNRNEFE